MTVLRLFFCSGAQIGMFVDKQCSGIKMGKMLF
jgi:hypothetical protein